MTQDAVVTKLVPDNMAEVAVARTTACGGNCGSHADYAKFPGYEYNFGCDCGGEGKVDEAAIAEIVKNVIANLK